MSYYENVYPHDLQELYESTKWPMPCDGDLGAITYDQDMEE